MLSKNKNKEKNGSRLFKGNSFEIRCRHSSQTAKYKVQRKRNRQNKNVHCTSHPQTINGARVKTDQKKIS